MTDTVTLQDILDSKEQRKKRQDAFLARYGTPIISVTVITPGSVKDTPAARALCEFAVSSIRERLDVVAEDHLYTVAGPEALLAIRGEVRDIKNAAVSIEEWQPFCRLLDLDVFAADGTLISRERGRKCLVCHEQAILCMRERRHSQAEIAAAVNQLLAGFSAYRTRKFDRQSEYLGSLAVEAMLYEVTCTPSPGLVDRVNNGAHTDMDFFSFMSSSAALAVALTRCAEAGLALEGPLSGLLPVLRNIGQDGERAMLRATNGVNTQKGLLFSLGIVVAAAGWLSRAAAPLTADAVLDTTALIVQGIVERELERARLLPPEKLTAGERLYLAYGVTGIRGEMEQGLPAVRHYALPTLRNALAAGLSVNDSLLQTLLVLLTHVDDTTVMHRHNPDKMRLWVRSKAEGMLKAGGMYRQEGRSVMAAMDEEFIRHNVSPGGVADLLAVTWFIHRVAA